MHPTCTLQRRRHDRRTNSVTITQALRCQVEQIMMADGCFERKIVSLELPRLWLPVHRSHESRLDSMHFGRMILVLFGADYCHDSDLDCMDWFAFPPPPTRRLLPGGPGQARLQRTRLWWSPTTVAGPGTRGGGGGGRHVLCCTLNALLHSKIFLCVLLLFHCNSAAGQITTFKK